MIVYICPNDSDHYIAGPDWKPSNPDIYKPQTKRDGNTGEVVNTFPRVNCPICRILGAGEVAREPHQVQVVKKL